MVFFNSADVGTELDTGCGSVIPGLGKQVRVPKVDARK